jgi:hypothetical protein
MVESITFNTAESKLIITFEDASTKEYTDADSYIADFPERVADAVAMGWVGGSDNSGFNPIG